MNIAIIGAGFSGLASARVLKRFGHSVTVYEKVDDVGGVWSMSRNYPSLKTQNVKETYSLSELDMPRDYPDQPRGDQVQKYLENYAQKFGLVSDLRLGTEVIDASQDEATGKWTITSKKKGADTTTSEEFDQLVVANGIFSSPVIPDYPGMEEYRTKGGVVCAVSECPPLEQLRGKHVLIVGYGKSACDITVPVSEVAASATVVARHLLWKLPYKVGNIVPYKYLFLTRLGEGLFPYHTLRGATEHFLHGIGKPVRNSMIGSVQSVVTRQLKLKKNNILPEGGFERIARSTVSLATDDFFDKVDEGKITVKRDTTILQLLEENGQLKAKLSNGETVNADVVLCGTGWKQEIPFFKPELLSKITNAEGDFELYQFIYPHSVRNLFFVGYNSSFFSPLSAETAALWVASYLSGLFEIPPEHKRREHVTMQLRWMKERTEGKHARGTNIIPFSMHNIDETLNEAGANIGVLRRFSQWFVPPNPAHYQQVADELLRRHTQKTGTPSR